MRFQLPFMITWFHHLSYISESITVCSFFDPSFTKVSSSFSSKPFVKRRPFPLKSMWLCLSILLCSQVLRTSSQHLVVSLSKTYLSKFLWFSVFKKKAVLALLLLFFGNILNQTYSNFESRSTLSVIENSKNHSKRSVLAICFAIYLPRRSQVTPHKRIHISIEFAHKSYPWHSRRAKIVELQNEYWSLSRRYCKNLNVALLNYSKDMPFCD